MRIGDFACGTGTLLSAAYSRLGLLHQIHGGNPATLHPSMMERGLVGLDVLNVAVHLTAAMLAGMYPQTPFEGECLLTMPYGRHQWGASLGSLELLNEQPAFDMFQAAAETAGWQVPGTSPRPATPRRPRHLRPRHHEPALQRGTVHVRASAPTSPIQRSRRSGRTPPTNGSWPRI